MDRQICFTRDIMLRVAKGCVLCKYVAFEPFTTPCGRRLCKQCLDGLFTNTVSVSCPFTHDDTDDVCPQTLTFDDFYPDRAVKRELSKEKCRCQNHKYGCKEEPELKDLQRHQKSCIFTPINCRNVGCVEKIAGCKFEEHMEVCRYSKMLLTPENNSEKDDYLCFECSQCQKKYPSREEMEAHQRTFLKCVTKPGKCFYYESCSFTAKSVEELKQHLQDNAAISMHQEYVNRKIIRGDQPRTVSIKTITRKKLQMVENPSDVDEATAPVRDAVQDRDGTAEV